MEHHITLVMGLLILSGTSTARPSHSADGNYEFHYNISEPMSGDIKSHTETRQGSDINGVYRFLQPDGCVRVVSYTADIMGFHPVVTYEGDCDPAVLVQDPIAAPHNLGSIAAEPADSELPSRSFEPETDASASDLLPQESPNVDIQEYETSVSKIVSPETYSAGASEVESFAVSGSTSSSDAIVRSEPSVVVWNKAPDSSYPRTDDSNIELLAVYNDPSPSKVEEPSFSVTRELVEPSLLSLKAESPESSSADLSLFNLPLTPRVDPTVNSDFTNLKPALQKVTAWNPSVEEETSLPLKTLTTESDSLNPIDPNLSKELGTGLDSTSVKDTEQEAPAGFEKTNLPIVAPRPEIRTIAWNPIAQFPILQSPSVELGRTHLADEGSVPLATSSESFDLDEISSDSRPISLDTPLPPHPAPTNPDMDISANQDPSTIGPAPTLPVESIALVAKDAAPLVIEAESAEDQNLSGAKSSQSPVPLIHPSSPLPEIADEPHAHDWLKSTLPNAVHDVHDSESDPKSLPDSTIIKSSTEEVIADPVPSSVGELVPNSPTEVSETEVQHELTAADALHKQELADSHPNDEIEPVLVETFVLEPTIAVESAPSPPFNEDTRTPPSVSEEEHNDNEETRHLDPVQAVADIDTHHIDDDLPSHEDASPVVKSLPEAVPVPELKVPTDSDPSPPVQEVARTPTAVSKIEDNVAIDSLPKSSDSSPVVELFNKEIVSIEPTVFVGSAPLPFGERIPNAPQTIVSAREEAASVIHPLDSTVDHNIKTTPDVIQSPFIVHKPHSEIDRTPIPKPVPVPLTIRPINSHTNPTGRSPGRQITSEVIRATSRQVDIVAYTPSYSAQKIPTINKKPLQSEKVKNHHAQSPHRTPTDKYHTTQIHSVPSSASPKPILNHRVPVSDSKAYGTRISSQRNPYNPQIVSNPVPEHVPIRSAVSNASPSAGFALNRPAPQWSPYYRSYP